MKELEELLARNGLTKDDIIIWIDNDSISVDLKEERSEIKQDSYKDLRKYYEDYDKKYSFLNSWSLLYQNPEDVLKAFLKEQGFDAENV